MSFSRSVTEVGISLSPCVGFDMPLFMEGIMHRWCYVLCSHITIAIVIVLAVKCERPFEVNILSFQII